MLHRHFSTDWESPGVHSVFTVGDPLTRLGLDLAVLESNSAPVPVGCEGMEVVLVVLSGTVSCQVDGRQWQHLGGRHSVFEGPPTAIYVPPGAEVRVASEGGRAEVAVCRSVSTEGPDPFVIHPADIEVLRRGQDHWRREIRNILTADLGPAVGAVVIGETVHDAGEWSGYPPHKHDADHEPDENIFEELYHYRIEPRDGFAVQVHYGDDRYPETGYIIGDGDSFAIPGGYHPAVVQGGYRLYYLWFMAGPSGRRPLPFVDPRYRHVDAVK